jgi:coproporphyrinogen III oxidase-like Fe-S oxidoreductase
VVGMGTVAVEKVGKSYFQKHEPISVYSELIHLQKDACQHSIAPEQIFTVVLKMDKNMAKDIEDRFGKSYANLTLRNKQRVINAYENKAHAIALAEAINEGALPVTSIALSTFSQLEWPAPNTKEKPEAGLSASTPDMTQDATVAKNCFVADLLAQRNAASSQQHII